MSDNQSNTPLLSQPCSTGNDSAVNNSSQQLLELLTHTDIKLDDLHSNELFGGLSQVKEGDVYLDICTPSLDLETGSTVGSQFKSSDMDGVIHTKLQGSDVPINTDLPKCVDLCLKAIKLEEDVVMEGNEKTGNGLTMRNNKVDHGTSSGSGTIKLPRSSSVPQEREATIEGLDQVANSIKTEEENFLSETNLKESTLTPVTRRSGRKRKKNPLYIDLIHVDNLDIDLSDGESEKRGQKRVETEDELYEPCNEETVVRKKRGRPKKNIFSSPLPPQISSNSNVSAEKVSPVQKVKHKEQATNTGERWNKVGKFNCQDCQKGFMSSLGLKKHKLTCKLLKSTFDCSIPLSHALYKSKPHCPVCHKSFVRRNGVKRHLTSEHSNLFHITCRLCYKKVGNIDETFDHMLSQHPSKFPDDKLEGVFCTVCGETFDKLYNLKQHVPNAHGNLLQLTCSLCQRTVGAMRDYLQHFQDFHTKSSKEKGSASDTRVSAIPSSASLQELKVSQSESEMVCPQCNKTVENYKLFILHTLSHKIDSSMGQVTQDCMQTSHPVLNTKLNPSHNNSKPLDEHPVSLMIASELGNIKGSFTYLGYDLISAFNRSLIAMTDMATKLYNDLQWNDSTCPKTKDDLGGKLSNLLRLSGGLTDIAKCLLLVLEECKELTGNDPLVDDDENNDCENDDENGEENDSYNEIDDDLGDKKEDEDINPQVLQTAEIIDDVIDNSIEVSFSQNGLSLSKELDNLNEEKVEEALGDSTKRNKSSDAICTGQTEGGDNFHEEDQVNQNMADGTKGKDKAAIASIQTETTVAEDVENDSGQFKLGVSKKKQSKKKKKKHICKICGKHLVKKSSVTYHRLIHMDIRAFQCKICEAKFKTDWALKKHSEVHLKDDKFKCDFCDVTVRTLKALHSHMDEHETENYFSCDECKHKARTSYDLATHQKVHQPVSCKKCDFQAKHVFDLKLHEKESHCSLNCPHCAYACATNKQLKRHLKTHDKNKNEQIFCCELCGATFNNHKKLSYHVLRHSNKTPFSCPHCDYKCSAKSSYQTHILKHSGLRPYLCTVCGVGFQRSSYLKQHALTHSDEKQFECKTCGKCFKYKYNFREHMMIHTGEKKFKCHLCNFACRRRKILDMHVAKHNVRGSDVEASENEM